MESARKRLGFYPKALRVARMAGGRWQIMDQQVVLFPDSGWVRLSVAVDKDRVRVSVNGETLPDVRVTDPVDGRVGVLKFYDNVVGFRAFEAR
jgi:hypothetical protein